MRWGISYYPEWIDPAEWERDLARMREVGFTTIRMLEFAWTRLEPREGELDFEWLDSFLDLAHGAGMEIVLGTPTPAVPRWLTDQYPDMRVELHTGERVPDGVRRNVCVNNTVYREFSRAIVRALALRYGSHPAVIGWQIDNELIGPEIPGYFECHCADCRWRFRAWLKQRYTGVEEINQRWWLHFWSLAYSAWSEVTTPRSRRAVLGQVLDHHRFYSDSLVEFVELQAEVLRKHIEPRQWVSHNATAVFDRGISHRDYSPPLDFVGWDAYPGAASGGHPFKPPFHSLAHDLFRGAKRAPFWVFETATDDRISPALFATMRAHGADAILLWHWRPHIASLEMGGARFCDLAGNPVPGRVATVHASRERLAEIDPELPAELPPASAAIVFSADCVRAEHRSPERPIPYLDGVIKLYRPFWRHGIASDVVEPDDELVDSGGGRARYRLLALPGLRLMSSEQGARIARFVEAGGVLVATFRTGMLDLHGKLWEEPASPVADALGVRIGSWLPGARSPRVVFADGRSVAAEHGCELIEECRGEVLATFEGGDCDGRPAVVRHDYGRGTVIYAATVGSELGEAIVRLAAEAAGIRWIENPFEDVQIRPHLTDARFWVINNGDAEATVAGVTVAPNDFALVAHEAITRREGA